MPATYEPIATTTLSANAQGITFSNIAASWTDLRLVLVGTDTAAYQLWLRFNSNSATNYSITTLRGNGTSASSDRQTNFGQMYFFTLGAFSTTIPSMCTADIFSYAGSTNKTVLMTSSLDKNGSGTVERAVGLWRNTSAITSIQIEIDSGSLLKTGTTATLYGILKA